MIPVVAHSGLLTLLYWALMIPIAVVILMRTTAFFADEGPSTVAGALRTILVMALAVFLTYDVSGYVFARAMQEPKLGIAFPPGYGYLQWVREPLGLKWHVLGFVPLIRYLPVLFALCAGGIVQVVLWRIPFRDGLVVFVVQLLLDVFAMAALSLVFSFFVGVGEGVEAKGRGPARPRAGARARATPDAPPAPGLAGMQQSIEKLGAEEGPALRRLWSRWAAVNERLAPVYDLLDPLTRHLPIQVRDFLHGGGWLLVGTGALCGVAWWRTLRARRSAAAGSAR